MAGRVNHKTVLFNAVLTVALIGLLAFNYQQEKLAREDMANTQGRPPAIGSTVPEFYLVDEHGEKIRFQDLHQQDTLLILWYLGCEPSTQLLGALHDLAAASPGLQVLPVSIADSAAEVRPFYQDQGWDFPVFVDAGKSAKWAFKASISPALYIIDGEGQIVHRQLGSSRHGFDYLASWIADGRGPNLP